MKTFILYIFIFFSFLSYKVSGQTSATSSNNIIEVEAIVKKSQQKYDDAKKKVYRAEEKLIHLKKIGLLSFNEVSQKENLLKKAKDKLEQMRLLLEHNNTLISQSKSNPSFGKSIRATASNSNAKSQRKTIQDIQQEKIEKLRKQQKQALVSKVKENRNKVNQQKTDIAATKKANSKAKKANNKNQANNKKNNPKNKNKQSNN